MITQEWVQPGNGEHRTFPGASDIQDAAGHTLVTSYAVLRPDGEWSVMMVKKDQWNAHPVRPGEISVLLAFFISKNELHGMCVPLVLFDHHHRPLPIRPKHCIGRNKRMACCILNVTRARKRAMLPVARLHPFLRNHWACEILGGWLLKLVFLRLVGRLEMAGGKEKMEI